MVYIVFNDSHEVDDCWHGGSSIDYISLSKDNAKNFFENLRNYYKNLEKSEVEENELNKFLIYNGNWAYDYELLELLEDTDLRYFLNNK